MLFSGEKQQKKCAAAAGYQCTSLVQHIEIEWPALRKKVKVTVKMTPLFLILAYYCVYIYLCTRIKLVNEIVVEN